MPEAEEMVHEMLDGLFDEEEREQIQELVSGDCSSISPDQFGESWAEKRGIAVKRFPADWNKHGKAAGPIRNAQMADYADTCVAFWDGESRGTKDMFDQMTRRAKPSFVVILPIPKE